MRAAATLALLVASGPAFAGFDMNRFFLEPTRGEGVVDTLTQAPERFRVSTRGRGSARRVRMAERFFYSNGRRRLQDWTIRRRDRDFIATRPDLKGPVRFRRLSDRTYRYVWRQWLDWPKRQNLVTVRGRLTRRGDGSVLNRATAYRGIIPVAAIRVTFRPVR